MSLQERRTPITKATGALATPTGNGVHGAPIRFATSADEPHVDVTPIHRAIEADAHMRHPPLESLQRSYDIGMAAVALDGERIVGYVRLMDDRINDSHYNALGVSAAGLPVMAEIGSGMMLPGYKGHNHYPGLRNYLLAAHQESITSGSTLVLGAGNNIQVLKALKHSESELGIAFSTLTVTQFHDEESGFPMTTQFFCNCFPRTDPAPRVGVQVPGCIRLPEADPTESITSESAQPAPANANGSKPYGESGTMPYWTIYWSSTEHLSRLEEALRSLYKARGLAGDAAVRALHDDLDAIEYYK